jgi:hypothetical protein
MLELWNLKVLNIFCLILDALLNVILLYLLYSMQRPKHLKIESCLLIMFILNYFAQ